MSRKTSRRNARLSGAPKGLDGASSNHVISTPTAQLARAALVDVPAVALAAASTVLLVRWKVNST